MTAEAGASSKSDSTWVCPNDRQLALRAQLRAGWCMRTEQNYQKKAEPLTDVEQEHIRQIMAKAAAAEKAEQDRVAKLKDKLENMQRRQVGNGTTSCRLCGSDFGFLGARSNATLCSDCKKYVCQKNCGVETFNTNGQPIFLCKICSERREMLKKSGAWFYGGVKNCLPPEEPSPPPERRERQPSWFQHPATTGNNNSSYESPRSTSPVSPARRRLPQPPSNKAPFRPDRPRWAVVHRHMSYTERDSDESPSDSYDPLSNITRRKIVQRRDSDSESDDRSPSPVSSHRESVPSPTSSQDHVDFSLISLSQQQRQTALDGGKFTDTSDSKSIDSGVQSVVPSDRSQPPSGANSRPTSLPTPQQQQPQSSGSCVGHTLNNNAGVVVTSGTPPAPDEPPSSSFLPRSASGLSNTTAKTATTSKSPSLHQCSSSTDDQHPASSPEDLEDPSNLGTIEFALLYDGDKQTLTVNVIRAEKLRAMDSNGFSDPYVKLHLLPGASKSTKLRTRTIYKTLNPEWNETLTYHGISSSEVVKKTLRITVFDEDRVGSDFLGETRVQLKRLAAGKERKFRVYLEKQLPAEKGDEVVCNDRGKLLMTLQYISAKQGLLVGIVRCAELTGMDSNGYSDPYVKVHLKPDKKLKFKTPVKKRTLNPEFNAEFFVPVPLGDLAKKTLEVTVFDKDVGKNDDYIGGVELGINAKGERLRHWYDCIKNPDKKFERWHKLVEEKFED